ncbi:extracellular solute-binding protein [Paenibacillus koleovorans]|uniref:extracellular solute-binding protein n=1 Tax=Paenibacillus koleovorans TaxID=121608 RepID=UPI000FD7142A|nr:extracellular solute-binding protein [Paenibacillus koleovorans]
MNGKRWLLLGSLIGVSVLLLFGAGNVFRSGVIDSGPAQGRHLAEPSPEPMQGTQELSIQVSMEAREFAALQQLKQQFQMGHANLSIQLENVPPRLAYSKWKKASQLGDAPDVLLLDNVWTTEFAALGYLLPVDSMLTGEALAQQMEQAVNQVKWNGYTWGVPKDFDIYVIVYNTKRLTELGHDKPPVSADELIALHTAASKPDEGKYGLYWDFEDTYAFASLVRAIGGSKLHPKAGPLGLTDPAVSKAVETLVAASAGAGELKGLAKAFPSMAVQQTWKPWEQLEQGKMAAMLTTLSDYRLHAKDGLAMTGLPLPKGDAVWKSGWLTGRSFAITSRTDMPKEAYEWIREMTTTTANIRFWSEGSKLPTVVNSYAAGGVSSDAAVKAIAPYLEKDDALAKPPQLSRQVQQLATGLSRVWKGELTWKAAAEQTEELWAGGAR